ncbi:MAG: methyltransferase domain-containing protein [bacterium]
MKQVYGDMYFAIEATAEIPEELYIIYQKGLLKLNENFKYNVVKISKDKKKVSLLYYPHLNTHAHPYLKNSILINLENDKQTIRNYKKNQMILHRLETFLSQSNPRREKLQQLTQKEESLGMFDKKHVKKIGRREYWDNLCIKKKLLCSLSPKEDIKPIEINREKTAIARTKASAPTRWALKEELLTDNIIDWGCGKGADSKYLKEKGFNVISYDPFYTPSLKLDNINFNKINTVLLNYVLNVVDNPFERVNILKTIKKECSPGTKLIVSVRSYKEIQKQMKKSKWTSYQDGVLTKSNTFQKGFTINELQNLCSLFGEIITFKKVSGGYVCLVSL